MLGAVLPLLFLLVVAAEPPPPVPEETSTSTRTAKRAADVPAWTPSELRTYFTRIPQSEGAKTVEEKDSFLADVAGAAYRVPRLPNEATELYAKRVVRKREPNHPNVKKGQWTLALMRLFYQDAGRRADSLSRFERDKNARLYFEAKAREAKQVADAIAGMIEIVVEGMEGFLAPLPIADGVTPEPYGCEASVKNGTVVVENLERAHFVNDAPPDNTIRTANGAIKELFAAQKQYNVSATMLGMYEEIWRKNQGNLRVVIPGAAPTTYLNELALAGVEADMHTVQVMCMTQKGELRALRLYLTPAKAKAALKVKKPPKGKKAPPAPKAPVEVSCASKLPMQKCVERLAEAAQQGPILFRVK